MFSIKFLSVLFIHLNKADIFLLPCPIKYVVGIDCPGCGFQRSVLALLSGSFRESFLLYPATVPLIISIVFCFVSSSFKMSINAGLLRTMYFVTGGIIIINYLYKFFSGQLISF